MALKQTTDGGLCLVDRVARKAAAREGANKVMAMLARRSLPDGSYEPGPRDRDLLRRWLRQQALRLSIDLIEARTCRGSSAAARRSSTARGNRARKFRLTFFSIFLVVVVRAEFASFYGREAGDGYRH